MEASTCELCLGTSAPHRPRVSLNGSHRRETIHTGNRVWVVEGSALLFNLWIMQISCPFNRTKALRIFLAKNPALMAHTYNPALRITVSSWSTWILHLKKKKKTRNLNKIFQTLEAGGCCSCFVCVGRCAGVCWFPLVPVMLKSL